MDLFTYGGDASADGEPGVKENSFSVLPFNIKAGLVRNVDLQFVLQTYAWDQQTEGGTTQRQRGLGALAVRTKINLWGNDRGRTAFAVMPFAALVSAPGGAERVFNLGIILPFTVDLGSGWGLSSMLEFDLAHESESTPRRVAMIGSASLSRDIVGKLSCYLEGYGGTILADGSAAWEATGDVGLTLGLGRNVQLDAGLNLGFTRVAEDVNPFLGLAVRF